MAAHTLILRANGTAELLAPNGEQQWASDSDEDFLDQWTGTLFLKESDLPELFNYLVDVGELTERQADACTVEEESLTEDDDAPEGAGDDD